MFNQQKLHLLTMLIAGLTFSLITSCSDESTSDVDKTKSKLKTSIATQVMARVNREEITVHQINSIMQTLPPRSDGLHNTSNQILEQLINQSLAQQQATMMGLDKSADIVQKVEANRRTIMAQAWADQITQDLLPATEIEQKKFYDSNPHWFTNRFVYQLHDLWADIKYEDKEKWEELLTQNPTQESFINQLKRHQIRFAATPVMQSSERMSYQEWQRLNQIKAGQPMVKNKPSTEQNGMQIWWLIKANAQPISWQQAQPLIENYLLQKTKKERIEQEISNLRKLRIYQFFW